MTIIEALKQTSDESGNIIIPIAQYKGENELPGTVSEAWLRAAFGTLLDLPIPVTEVQFNSLKDKVTGQWQDNWQWYRENNVITVV